MPIGGFMKFNEVFGNAKWICPSDKRLCPIIRTNFEVKGVMSAVIDIIGFASFLFYINGKAGSGDLFLPLVTDFEKREAPVGEQTRHRVYVSKYDVTELIHDGKNTLAVLLGNGWYTGHTGKYREVPYGEKKLCFKLTLETTEGVKTVYSDTDARFSESFVKESDLNFGELHDYSGYSDDMLLPSYDDSLWENAEIAKSPETEYLYTDCPADRVIEEITPTLVKSEGNLKIYDAGKNLTGFPTLVTNGYSGTVKVRYSEALGEGLTLKEKNMHGQYTDYKVEGGHHILEPKFTWLGFRYFSVEGEATVKCVKRINSDVKVNSSFECDNEDLNWLYNAFVLTELSNMHQGIPSDCPHIERRGYLGDGHLTAEAAMLSLDAKEFYKKWIGDISDSQDSISGHAQYTAPYTHSGGGPGSFAHGFIKIPYQYYLHYGDDEPLKNMYGQFKEYLRYLEDHSEYDLLVSDKEGEWCLGEWCVPNDRTGDMLAISDAKPGGSFLPPAYVNTVYFVKSLMLLKEIAGIIGKEEDIPAFEERIARKKAIIKAAFFNPNNGNFMGNMQGGNAFALDIGLGDERTKESFILYYEKNPYFDTGIFGTEIVSRLLAEYGRADLLVKMIGAREPRGFGRWRELGATTLWEYWDAPRSMSHPMFGSVASLLFKCILGIKMELVGFEKVTIEPSLNTPLKFAKGYITTPQGRLSVEYRKLEGEIMIKVNAPVGTEATVKLLGKEFSAISGEAVYIKEKI